MTRETEPATKLHFVRNVLPWVIAAAALALYLGTLNHWVSSNSLLEVARASGWTWQPALSEPLYRLLTYPVHWLSPKAVPLALNVFSMVCAVLTLALLARSVALLPHDRTHEQRQREKSEFFLLSIRAAWLPPVLAALVCGLQLTFWEHATVATIEMLNLLIFAYVIRCLLEFRIDQRESWLTRAAFVYGLGMTNNWGMIGFFPLFIAALIWIRGLNFFNLQFLGRMLVYGLAGLLLYLLLPLVQSRGDIAPVPFWQGLKVNLGNQEGILMVLFRQARQTTVLLALTSVLPIIIIAIKWASYFGDTSQIGVWLATFMFHIVHALFLAACIWVALDPPISPRHMGGGIPLLTFYYLGALSVGYFSGYFLLVFTDKQDRSRRRSTLMPLINGFVRVAVWLLLLLTPVVMVSRNFSQIRLSNGHMQQDFAKLLSDPLPPRSAVLSDDPRRLLLAQAARARSSREDSIVFIDTASLEYPQYHRFLKKRYGSDYPFEAPKTLTQKVDPLSILRLLLAMSATNGLYYLHPSVGYYFEHFYLEPHGLVYRASSYPSGKFFPPAISKELIEENNRFWADAQTLSLAPLLQNVDPSARPKKHGPLEWFYLKTHLKKETNRDITMLASFYSRALDNWAVELQKADFLEPAANHFERALELNPENVAAQVSLECNKNLQAGRQTAVQMSKAVTDSFGKYSSWNMVITENGPFDEPTFCYEQGNVMVGGKLYRQACQQFERVRKLDPMHLPARLWLAQLYILLHRPDDVLPIVEEVMGREKDFSLNSTNKSTLLFARAAAYLAKKDGPDGETAVQAALQLASPDVRVHALAVATQVYMNYGFFSNALSTIEQELQAAPDDLTALVNKGYACLQINAFDRAIPVLSQALAIQTNNSAALLNRAIAYLRSGQLDSAQRDYETLQKLSPSAYAVYYGLAEIAFQRNDTNSAVRNYELYLTNNPLNPEEIKVVTNRLALLKR